MMHFFRSVKTVAVLVPLCTIIMTSPSQGVAAGIADTKSGIAHGAELFIIAPPDIDTGMDWEECQVLLEHESLGSPTLPENCTNCTVTRDYDQHEYYSYYDRGTTTITWTVTDAHGNTASDTQNITVSDDQPPIFPYFLPDTYTATAEAGRCGAHVTFEQPGASDNCGSAAIRLVNGDYVSGDFFAVGLTELIYEAEDESGNTDYFSLYIIVEDTQAPVFTSVPEPVTRPADPNSTEATFSLPTPLATDNCGNPDVNSDAPTSFPVGTTTVTWRADDYHGNTTTITQLVTITWEECPAFDLAEIEAPQEAQLVNGLVEVSIAMRAGGEVSSATWYWGDGSQSAGTQNNDIISGSHRYSQAGMYTIEVYLENSCGETASITHHEQLVVVAPAAGFITGGGWFNSPAGAWLNNPLITGKAHFSLNSKYHKAAATPKGSFTFKLQAAGLDFRGTSQDWLIVAEQGGWYSGRGTLNGSSGYRYLVAVADGGSGKKAEDKIRIILWDPAGEVIYDNQQGVALNAGATQAVDGGAVVIHTRKEEHNKGAGKAATAAVEELTPDLSAIAAYPNPLTAAGLWLAFPQIEKEQEIKAAIYDLKGRLIAEKAFTINKVAGQYHWAIDHSNWSGGVYLLKISGEQLTKQLKLIK